jgi:Flp pilus assembly protein TadD
VDGLIGRPAGPGSAGALLSQGRAAEALARADADLKSRPDDMETLLVRAAALASMTRYAEADAAYGALLERAPKNAQALAGRAWVLRALGRDDSAAGYVDSLLALPPGDVNVVTAQFVCLYHRHRYEPALALVRAELSKPDVRPPAVSHLRALEAVAEIALGRAEAALRLADALVASRPDDFAIHELGALASVQLARFDDARQRARRALAGAPHHPELLETLGIIERLSGHPERAYDALLEAATLRPELPRARAELSACFTQLGRHGEAAAALDDLPPWWTDEPSLHYARACALTAAGRHDEAMDRLARATGIRPGLLSIARLDPVLVALFQREGAGGRLTQDGDPAHDGDGARSLPAAGAVPVAS